MTSRDAILRRIHTALHDVPPTERPADVAVARNYLTVGDGPRAEILAQFAERVAEYKASVHHVSAEALPAAIAETLAARGITRVVVPADAPAEWTLAIPAPILDSGQLTYAELDASEGVLTGCTLGIAQTGTIVLDHGTAQGRRAISLIPDYHLCVVRAEQIVGVVPEAIGALGGAARKRRPLTFISGPSATSDIELNRVEGVHGPRTLEVLIVQ